MTKVPALPLQEKGAFYRAGLVQGRKRQHPLGPNPGRGGGQGNGRGPALPGTGHPIPLAAERGGGLLLEGVFEKTGWEQDSLGAGEFVAGVVKGSAGAFQAFLPAVVFLIGCFLAFATGTSWGTFGILIPITLNVFPLTDPLGVVCVSACMAGAVCGDHCSPISDTTIMASAGAQSDHVDHVSTQLPYAVAAAAVSFVAYLVAGFVPNALIVLPVAVVLMAGTLFGIRTLSSKSGR